MQTHSASRKYLVAGNWKMNTNQTQAHELLGALVNGLPCASDEAFASRLDVLVFPPFVHLAHANDQLKDSIVGLGAQNCASQTHGAYTGEVSAGMLQDAGCQAVILGHSERRALFGESNADVLEKTQRALENGLLAVVCVGETLGQREGGNYTDSIHEQLAPLVDALTPDQWANVVIAYEPVWAIGTGLTATPEQAQEVHRFIRGVLNDTDAQVADRVQIIYGGSVNAANAAELFAQPDVDGGLVGGASLKADDFIAICNAVG